MIRNPIVSFGLICAFGVIGLLLQASQALGHDLGWLLFATERLLDGADVYGRDVFEWNPPANLYLLTPAVIASDWLDVSVATAARLYIAGLIVLSLALCSRIARSLFEQDPQEVRRYELVVAAFALFIGVEGSFGQREHLIVIGMLPELFLISAIVSGRRSGEVVDRKVAVAAGAAAAIAICIKPQYVLLLLLWEGYVGVRRRSLVAWLRPDFVALAVVGAIQLLSLVWLTPGYLRDIVPLALDTYWVYQGDVINVVETRDVLLLPLVLLVFPLLRGRRVLLEWAGVLLLAALGFYATAIFQRTGWRYHFVPYQVAMFLLLTLPIIRGIAELAERGRSPHAGLRPALKPLVGAGVAMAGALLLLATPNRYADTYAAGAEWRAGRSKGLVSVLEQALREHAGGGAVYVVSPSLVNVFPAINRAGVDWSSRFSAFYLPAAVVRQRRGDAQVPSRLTAERAEEIDRFLRNAVVEDLRARPPSLILIDHVKRRKVFAGVPFEFLDYLLEDPRFAEIWAEYEPISKVGRFDAAVRRGALETCKADVHVVRRLCVEPSAQAAESHQPCTLDTRIPSGAMSGHPISKPGTRSNWHPIEAWSCTWLRLWTENIGTGDDTGRRSERSSTDS